MSHFWWDGEAPPSPPDEAEIRDAALVGDPEPPYTWKRWIAPVSTLLSVAGVVFLFVRVLQNAPELPPGQRPYAIYAYFDIILISLVLGGVNWLLWRKWWRW